VAGSECGQGLGFDAAACAMMLSLDLRKGDEPRKINGDATVRFSAARHYFIFSMQGDWNVY